jgi:ABC-type Fe3+-siderophore transport system permease subunit
MNVRKSKPFWIFLITLILLIILIPISVCFGDVKIPLSVAIDTILHPTDTTETLIIWEYRFPRTIVALLVGISLAVAGALLQAITQNPLAAPNVIGITGGASFFAVVSMILIPNFPVSALPYSAFVGSALAGLLVYLISWKNGVSKERFTLSGIALDALFAAGTTGILVYSSAGVDAAIVWLAGSFWGRDWTHVSMILPWTLGCLFIILVLYKRINVMLLGDDVATGLGLPVQSTRFILLGLTIVLAGSAVAVSGPVGFIGLVIPHLTRLLVGSDYKWVISISALLGAILAISSDLLGRTLLAPIEIPVGVVTALLGAPYFLFLLKKSKI